MVSGFTTGSFSGTPTKNSAYDFGIENVGIEPGTTKSVFLEYSETWGQPGGAPTFGGSCATCDTASNYFARWVTPLDEIYCRVYLQQVATTDPVGNSLTTIMKFIRFYDVGGLPRGGVYLFHSFGDGSGGIVMNWDLEDGAQGSGIGNQVTQAVLEAGGVHSLEIHYMRNAGHPSGLPAMEFWWDGVHTTHANTTPTVPNKTYWDQNVLIVNERSSSAKLQWAEIFATLNGCNQSNARVRISAPKFSTQRIGP